MAIWVENDTNLVLQNMRLAIDNTQIPAAALVASVGNNSGDAGTAGVITDAENAGPIVITSAGHGLNNGDIVIVCRVKGNRAANGTWVVANKTTDTFELSGSNGTGAYTSGGIWYKGILGATGLTVSAIVGQPGRYYCVIPSTASIEDRKKYVVVIFCSNYGLEFEHAEEGRVRL
jgi:hypothetical protein